MRRALCDRFRQLQLLLCAGSSSGRQPQLLRCCPPAAQWPSQQQQQHHNHHLHTLQGAGLPAAWPGQHAWQRAAGAAPQVPLPPQLLLLQHRRLHASCQQQQQQPPGEPPPPPEKPQQAAGADEGVGTSGGGGDGGGGRPSPDAELLSEFRTASAEWFGSGSGGLQWTAEMFLTYPQLSDWSYLYRRPSLLARLLWPKGGLTTWLLRCRFMRARPVALVLLEEAHQDFPGAESFSEEAAGAVAQVLRLFAAGDFDSLGQGMVSQRLLGSMQAAWEAQQAAAGAFDLAVVGAELDEARAEVVCVHSMTLQQLAAFDERRAEAAARAPASGGEGEQQQLFMDVVHVFVEGVWRAHIGSASGASREVAVPRCGHFALARGPLRSAEQLQADADCPWFMLAWL